MRNGFIFKDRHSSDFGVTVRTKSRPILPSVKENIVDLPYRDGGYDFSKANPFGREFYNDRIFTVMFNIYADNLAEMQRKLSLLSLWLCGEGELIFDDMPFSKWRGKVSDEVIYMPEHSGRKAVMEVSFRAEPFCKCIFNTDGPTLEMPFMLGANIPVDISCLFKFNISGSGDISVYNFGDRPVRPIVKLGASARNVTLSMNGKLLAFMSNGQTTIDFEKQNVKNTSGNILVSGEFFEFPSGRNKLHIVNSNSQNMTAEISYTPYFMYGEHFDDLEWGDGNA